MDTQVLERRNGDVFIETPRAEYGMITAKLKNGGLAAVVIPKQDLIGWPVKIAAGVATLAVAGDEATAAGLIFDPQSGVNLAAGASTDVPYAILVRGPAVVNLGEIKDGLNVTTLATTLAALDPPIIPFTDESLTEDSNS